MKNLTKTYNQGHFCVLDRISCSLDKGDLVAIVGESGSGKTTLLNILYGLTEYDEGSCKIKNINLQSLSLKEKQKFRHDYMGYVPQDYGLIEEWTVYDNIMLPLMFYKEDSFKRDVARLKSMFNSMHLDYSKYIYRKASLLSGGEKQRVAIARALITNPQILIADELTSALDYEMSINIVSLLQNLSKSGLTIVFSTHDKAILNHCDKIISLKNGKIF